MRKLNRPRQPGSNHRLAKRVDARRRPAFTVIELLVVIGIIALLIAILLPVVHRSRQKARALACKAQLHDLGASMQMYLNNNKGRYPLAPSLPSVNPKGYDELTDLLAPYTTAGTGIFRCPGDEVVFPVEEISFFYYEELGTTPLKQTFFYKVMKSASAVPVLWDASNFHGGNLPFNWLFADGHVEGLVVAAK